MKTTAKQFTVFGNTSIVQICIDPVSEFIFQPGGPEMKSGGLIISESTEGGVVGRLTALNNTGSYLLLTDADVLIGAKQNRIINKSVLLAPYSKTPLDVSCIERLRWSYNNKNFSSPESAADHDLRKAKAASMSFLNSEAGAYHDTQGTVWSHINDRLAKEGIHQETESYHAMAGQVQERKAKEFPFCEAEKGCCGLAVFSDGKVQSIDLFGNEEVYRYYFPMLRDAAFRMAGTGKDVKVPEMHEAYYKSLDAIDSFEAASRKPEEAYTGSGILTMIESEKQIGFGLSMNEELIHRVIFQK
ncbi:MAG TPA: DUF6569 family protein [Bacteroidales bacterium]|nr:DUF6569 family protein [Bacteroidales bacterium]